jgi:hypothetical protein
MYLGTTKPSSPSNPKHPEQQWCNKPEAAAAHLRKALLLNVPLLHSYQLLQPMLFELGSSLLRP